MPCTVQWIRANSIWRQIWASPSTKTSRWSIKLAGQEARNKGNLNAPIQQARNVKSGYHRKFDLLVIVYPSRKTSLILQSRHELETWMREENPRILCGLKAFKWRQMVVIDSTLVQKTRASYHKSMSIEGLIWIIRPPQSFQSPKRAQSLDETDPFFSRGLSHIKLSKGRRWATPKTTTQSMLLSLNMRGFRPVLRDEGLQSVTGFVSLRRINSQGCRTQQVAYLGPMGTLINELRSRKNRILSFHHYFLAVKTRRVRGP